MKAASLASILVFVLVGAAHLLRVVLGVELLINGTPLPMWVSIAATLVTTALAVGLWRERRAS